MIGQVISYAGQLNPARIVELRRLGWVLCNGEEYSIDLFNGLFDVIGEAFNTPQPREGFFRVPDFQGRVGIGVGHGRNLSSRALGDKQGVEKHVLTEAELAPHGHRGTTGHNNVGIHHNAPGHRFFQTESGGGEYRYWVNPTVGHSHDVMVGNTGEGQPHENMPPYLAIHFLIQYRATTGSLGLDPLG